MMRTWYAQHGETLPHGLPVRCTGRHGTFRAWTAATGGSRYLPYAHVCSRTGLHAAVMVPAKQAENNALSPHVPGVLNLARFSR